MLPSRGKAPNQKKPGQKDQEPPPDVEVGDEVYFRHRESGQPLTGMISARGQHGCHVDCDRRRYRVRWEDMLGHKYRIRPQYSVVDTGEDGMIVQEPAGRKRYIHDPDSKTAAAPVAKSALPMFLLFGEGVDEVYKAIKNRPGLSLQDVTDKAGNQTKRWKRTAKPEKKERKKKAPDESKAAPAAQAPEGMKRGTKVNFNAGGFSGAGTIVGTPGRLGARVRDDKGNIHKVGWHEIGGPAAPPAAAPGGGGKRPPENPPAPPAPAYEPRKDGEGDKEYAKRVVDKTEAPTSLPEDAGKYFKTDGAVAIPITNLKSSKTDEENQKGGDNGPKRMLAAYHGALGKRDPIKVTPNTDGTYTVVDGNGTLTSAKKMGWEAIPTWVVQPQGTEQDVYKAAGEANGWLGEWLNKGKGICDQLGYKTMGVAPEDVADSDWDKPGGMFFQAPLKKGATAKEKVEKDYAGDWSRIKDISRCTIAVDTIPDLQVVIERLHKSGMVVAQPMKDRYNGDATSEGYRDINIVVRSPNGHLVEVQVNAKEMVKAKNAGHPHYDVTRKILKDYGKKRENWPADVAEKFAEAKEAQKTIYDAAYKKLQGSPSGEA